MKIADIVRAHIPSILQYCETVDRTEFARLQDARYCKDQLDINYPFFATVPQITPALNVRYWSQKYRVCGAAVRITSQWFNPSTSKSAPFLRAYLQKRGIPLQMQIDVSDDRAAPKPRTKPAPDIPRASKGRYRGTAIGVAQNALVRNILSRLGTDTFSADDWQGVRAVFGQACAYCGVGGNLVMDHAIPINRESLGEHHLGNLVPACAPCNAAKAQQDFRSFLGDQTTRIAAIEAHMARYNYTPIGENLKLQAVIEAAHAELRQLADRYVALIETTLPRGDM